LVEEFDKAWSKVLSDSINKEDEKILDNDEFLENKEDEKILNDDDEFLENNEYESDDWNFDDDVLRESPSPERGK